VGDGREAELVKGCDTAREEDCWRPELGVPTRESRKGPDAASSALTRPGDVGGRAGDSSRNEEPPRALKGSIALVSPNRVDGEIAGGDSGAAVEVP
jgi:hypothetical protein